MNQWPEETESQKMLLEQVRAFCLQEIAPQAAKLDATGHFPSAIIQKASTMGLLGLMVDEKYSGSGVDTVSYARVIEEISSHCASTGVIISVNNSLVCAPIEKYGTEAQKEKFLIPLAKGEKLGAFALSEPGHGSDPAGLECTATEQKNGSFILKGNKNWITNGKEAGTAIVFATLDKTLKHKGIAAFIVDTQTPGFEVAKLEHKMGIVASSTAQLFFNDVHIPKDQLLGKPGEGLKIALSTLDGGRIGIAAQALGIGKAALEASKKFSLEREQFGAPIAKLQAIQWFIADMATRLQAARLLTWDAARNKDLHLPFTKQAAMAKLSAAEAAMWVATKAIQVHGGYGFTKEYSVERNFRDAKITEIYEGTSEIQRLVIAAQELAEAKE